MSEFALGDYIFTRKRIGKGAFSTIYKGRHKETNKLFAIKEISFENLEKIRESIKREFTLMKKLNHKNIIRLHEVFFDNDEKNIYLVIDYYSKGDLSKFLGGKALKEKYAKKYMRQLTMGLKYLYEKQILHRDLKPQNILVTDEGNIVITDFGFARYTDNENMLNTLCGSPMYMAPEIMLKKRYNNKSDLWSVGVIFFELLYGTTPYKAKNMIDLMSNIKKKPIKFPHNNITLECRNLLLGLLQKDPDNRIPWEELFEHAWFQTDEIMETENALMDISFTKSFPNIKSLSASNQFKSTQLFKHKSIRESSDNNEDLQFNMSISDSDSKNTGLQLNISEKQADSSDDDEEDDEEDEEDDDVFKSVNSFNEEKLDNNNNNNNGEYRIVSEPININSPRNIKNGYESSIFQSHKNGFHVIDSVEYKYMSEPTGFNYEIRNDTSDSGDDDNNFKDSVKNLLSSSFHFLRMSINYFTRKTV